MIRPNAFAAIRRPRPIVVMWGVGAPLCAPIATNRRSSPAPRAGDIESGSTLPPETTSTTSPAPAMSSRCAFQAARLSAPEGSTTSRAAVAASAMAAMIWPSLTVTTASSSRCSSTNGICPAHWCARHRRWFGPSAPGPIARCDPGASSRPHRRPVPARRRRREPQAAPSSPPRRSRCKPATADRSHHRERAFGARAQRPIFWTISSPTVPWPATMRASW